MVVTLGEVRQLVERCRSNGGTVTQDQWRVLDAALGEAEKESQDYADSLAVVAHDLRVPLQSILFGAEALRSAMADKLVPRHERLLASIIRGSRWIDRMLQDYLVAGIIESGVFKVSLGAVSIRAIIAHAVEWVESGESVDGDRTAFSVDGVPDAWVLGDEDRLMQVVVNLLHNAVKWNKTGSPVEVSARVLDKAVVISVADRGPGVPDKIRSMIFNRFIHGDNRGSGVGLYVARSIVEAHGGRIWMEPRDGGGSIFTFSLAATDMRSTL